MLAEADTHGVVNSLQEVYLDFQAINPNLYSLDIPASILQSVKPRANWTPVEVASYQRMVDGIYSVLLSVRGKNPCVRYDESSSICQKLAADLDHKISTDS